MNPNDFFKKKSKYNPDTGIASYIDSNIGICKNRFGFYEEYIKNEEVEINPLIFQTSTHYSISKNENEIAKLLFSENNSIKYNKRLGYYQELYVGHVNQLEFRKNSSSGGIATWILRELLVNDLIDGVIHVGRSATKGKLFEYRISRTLEEIYESAKTKYYPVELSKVLKEVRDKKGRYAIVGIPSFISSIRLLQEIDPVMKERIVFCIGLVCGHQKSVYFSEYMGWQAGFEPGNLTYIDFRKKIPHSPANQYGIKVIGKIDNEEISKVMLKNELDGQNWGHGYFKKPESDYVDDVMNETADITLGDAWLKEYNEDYLGNNIVIVRNEILHKIIKEGKKSGELNLKKATESTIIQSQEPHFRHTQDELMYRMKKEKSDYVPARRCYSNDISLIRKMIQNQRLLIRDKSTKYYVKLREKNQLELFEDSLKLEKETYQILYRLKGVLDMDFSTFLKKLLLKMKTKIFKT